MSHVFPTKISSIRPKITVEKRAEGGK